MNKEAWDISIESLNGGYGGRLILRDFSAVMPAGTITTILGEEFPCGSR